ncbi:MAG: flagellin, partial [Micavibrio sp.]|nr:flagellin [Micavibrio sp.]
QLQEDYNNVRDQIDQLVEDANYRGVNLLNGDNLTTFFNEDRSNTLITDGIDFTSLGLGLATGDFTNVDSIQDSITQAQAALESVRRFGSSIANDLAIIQVRQDFTTQTINTLESGADDLTVADANQEGANLLALQTRQQLGVTSLSLASQSEQSVLRLF